MKSCYFLTNFVYACSSLECHFVLLISKFKMMYADVIFLIICFLIFYCRIKKLYSTEINDETNNYLTILNHKMELITVKMIVFLAWCAFDLLKLASCIHNSQDLTDLTTEREYINCQTTHQSLIFLQIEKINTIFRQQTRFIDKSHTNVCWILTPWDPENILRIYFLDKIFT